MALESEPTARRRPSTMESLAIVLVAITGVIHLYEGVEDLNEPIGVLFLLAGLGFLGAIGLFYLGVDRSLLYLVGTAYTGIQIVAYFALRWPDVYEPLGLFDKVVQVVLVVVLVVLYRRSTD